MLETLIKFNPFKLVLTPSTNDLNKFEDNLPRIIQSLKSSSVYYTLSVEHEDSNRHLDCVLFCTQNRWDNISRKCYKILHEVFDNTNTNWEILIGGSASKNKIIKDSHNIKKRLGYNIKECPERHYSNIDADFHQECLQYYLKNKEDPVKKNRRDIFHLNKNNMLCEILNFMELNPEIKETEIQVEMIKKGYSFLGLSNAIRRDAIVEANIMLQNKDSQFHNPQEVNDKMNYSTEFLALEYRKYQKLSRHLHEMMLTSFDGSKIYINIKKWREENNC